MAELLYYVTPAGESLFEKWFLRLNAQAAAKVTVALARLEQDNFSSAKAIGEGVFEFRIDWGPGYRVYFGRDGEHYVILLTGGTKKRQQEDISRAKNAWDNYKQRKRLQ
jgi:putative addiction module killer protein